MNYKLELNAQDSHYPIIFHNILFDAFKINIIERHSGTKQKKLQRIVIKVRTHDDEIVKTKTEAFRIILKGDDYVNYEKLTRIFTSYEFKNKLINRKEKEQEYVYFLLQLVINYYQLN
ncbi:MAG: prevent-host-death protein [Chryseobacterium sp.]|nr:MAG: prevent-host-death protein [Chryseobacterium sp.]